MTAGASPTADALEASGDAAVGRAPRAATAVTTVAAVVATTRGLDALLRPVSGSALGWRSVGLDFGEHLALILAAWLAVSCCARRLGLVPIRGRRVVTGAAVIYATFVIASRLLDAAGGSPVEQAGAHALGRVHATSLLAAFALLACVVAPFTEEVLFRGLLFPAVRESAGRVPAAVTAGALFGLVHAPPWGAAPELALLGIALCAVYEHTGSIVPCVGIHSLHNAIAFAAAAGLSAPAAAVLLVGGVPAAVAVGVAASRPSHSY